MSSRTRSKGSAPTTSATGTVCVVSGSFRSPKPPGYTYSAGSYGSGNNWTVNIPESREAITDVIGNRSGHNTVTHTKKFVPQPTTQTGPIYEYTNSTSPFGVATCQCASGLALQLTSPTLLDHLAVPDGTLIARARAMAVNKPTVDGLVELYELKDLASQLGSVASILMDARARQVSTGRTYGKSVARQIRDEFLSSPSQFLSSLINAHLGYKFAVAPLARAVNDVMSTLGRLDDTMQRIKKPFVVHGTYSTSKENNYSTSWNTEPSTFGLYQTRFVHRKTTKVTWVQSALRQIDPNKLPTMDRQRLQVFLDQIGLHPTAVGLWNMIPRSFIIDWFFPIRDFLEQASGESPTSAWFTTLSTYGSVKSVTTGSVSEEFAPLTASGTTTRMTGLNVLRGEYSSSTYTRTALVTGSTWSPATPFVPEPRPPLNKESWITLGEMLYQGTFKALRVKHRSFGK